jgi:hypothetical protein
MDGALQDPERGIQVTMMLANYVEAPGGASLTIVGGGANIAAPKATHAIALLFQVPWHLANKRHEFRLDLIDVDGGGVAPEEGDGGPLVVQGQFEVGRPPGARAGMTFTAAVPINLGMLTLPPSEQFEWRCHVNGETQDDWRLVFYTTPPAAQEKAA